MKKIILFVSLFITFQLAEAQIKLYNLSGVEISGDTIVFNHLLDTTQAFNLDFEHKNIVRPVNESPNLMVIDVIREEIDIINGTGDYFCWGTQCFGEVAAGSRTIWKANDPVMTPSDSSAGGIGFAVYFAHHDKLGQALYKYTFIDDNNTANKASIYVKYNIYAEELTLMDDNGASIENQTVLDWRAIDTTNRVESFKFENLVNLTNNTGKTLKIALSRDEVNVLNNVADSIIWNGVSYSKTTKGQMVNRTFPDTLVLNPNETITSPLKVFYFANDAVGESQYKFNLNVTSAGSSSSSTLSFDFKIGTSYLTNISQEEFNQSFNLYPNPATDVFKASFAAKHSKGNKQINIYNIVGEKVFSRNLVSGVNKSEININSLSPGVYFVNILSNEKLLGSKKLIVK